jgi:hypothetical protein
MSLRYVKEIHSRLSVRYGSLWRAKWDGIPMEAVEADWAEELDGMPPESIRKALESLPPDFPPTAPAFRALGSIRRESEAFQALPAPAINKEVADSALSAYKVTGKPTPGEWMAQLDQDVKAGTASPARKRHHAIATENGYSA